MVATASSKLTSKAPRLGTGDSQTGQPTAIGNPASGGPLVKVEENLEQAVYV